MPSAPHDHDAIARKIAAHLDDSVAPEVAQRLRSARIQAVCVAGPRGVMSQVLVLSRRRIQVLGAVALLALAAAWLTLTPMGQEPEATAEEQVGLTAAQSDAEPAQSDNGTIPVDR